MKLMSYYKDISVLNKHSKLYSEIFRVKKALLLLSKSVANNEILENDKLYLQILKRRIKELEELFFNKNFEIQNHILKDEVRFGKLSIRYSV